jgi:hypothetical protein
MSAPAANSYSQRLGMEPPDLHQVARYRGVRTIDLVAAALIERGEPMSLEDLTARLRALGIDESRVPLEVSIRKACTRGDPVSRDHDGRFALDPSSHYLDLWFLANGRRAWEAIGPVTIPPQPGPDTPLSRQEIEAAFRGRPLTQISGPRVAAAVLEAFGRPMEPGEIEAYLRDLTSLGFAQPAVSSPGPNSRLVRRDTKGRFTLDATPESLRALRTAIRTFALPAVRAKAEVAAYRAMAERVPARPARGVVGVPGDAGASKVSWRGTLLSVQPRIRLTRSFDQRSHSYLGYVLRVRGSMGQGEEREFLVAVGKAAHEKHRLRAGDEVSGEGAPVTDPDLETADL